MKISTIIENKTNKSDPIDINKNSKPETDLVEFGSTVLKFKKRFSKLTGNREQISSCKPENYRFFEIIRQFYLKSFYSAASLFMQQMIKIRFSVYKNVLIIQLNTT